MEFTGSKNGHPKEGNKEKPEMRLSLTSCGNAMLKLLVVSVEKWEGS